MEQEQGSEFLVPINLSEGASTSRLEIHEIHTHDAVDNSSSHASLIVGKRKKSILQELNLKHNQLTDRELSMYRKVIYWSNRVTKLQTRITWMKKKIGIAERLAAKPNFKNLLNHVTEPTYNFILSHIRNQQTKSKGRRITQEDKILALSLRKASGQGYNLLSKIFALPSRKTLTNLLNRVPLTPGINETIFHTL